MNLQNNKAKRSCFNRGVCNDKKYERSALSDCVSDLLKAPKKYLY